jgi:uncharacterized protein (UPF0332 family)
MTGEEILLQRAQESLRAARIMLTENLPNIAASRAYYAMFYTAELLLQKKGLTFTSHSAVIAAFGKEFARSGELDPKFHRYMIASQNARQIGDYGGEKNISPEEASQIIGWVEEFIKVADIYLHDRE